MNLSLNQPSYNSIDYFIKAIYEIFDNLKDSKDNISKNFISCIQIRKKRKKVEKEIRLFIKNFDSVGEKKQVDVELHFFNSIKEMDLVIPLLKKHTKKEANFIFAFFLIRELDKLQKIVKTSQKKMADRLYPDNSKEILSNPALYQSLVDAWGDLAEDEY